MIQISCLLSLGRTYVRFLLGAVCSAEEMSNPVHCRCQERLQKIFCILCSCSRLCVRSCLLCSAVWSLGCLFGLSSRLCVWLSARLCALLCGSSAVWLSLGCVRAPVRAVCVSVRALCQVSRIPQQLWITCGDPVQNLWVSCWFGCGITVGHLWITDWVCAVAGASDRPC